MRIVLGCVLALALVAPAAADPVAVDARVAALAGLRGRDVVRVRLASGAVLEGPWGGLAGDSLQVGSARLATLDEVDRVEVLRSSRGAYMAVIGVLWGLTAGWIDIDRSDEIGARTFDGGDAAVGLAAGVAAGALVGSHRTHWATLYSQRHGAPGGPPAR